MDQSEQMQLARLAQEYEGMMLQKIMMEKELKRKELE